MTSSNFVIHTCTRPPGKLGNAARLLEQEVDLEKQDDEGFTALIAAAEANRTDIAALLLSSGATTDVQAAGNQGISALMAAAYMVGGCTQFA